MRDEGQGGDGYDLSLAAQLGIQWCPPSRHGRSDVPHGGGAADGGSEAPRSHAADRRSSFAISEEQRTGPHGATGRQQTHALAGDAALELPENDFCTGESTGPGAASSARA